MMEIIVLGEPGSVKTKSIDAIPFEEVQQLLVASI